MERTGNLVLSEIWVQCGGGLRASEAKRVSVIVHLQVGPRWAGVGGGGGGGKSVRNAFSCK